MSEAPAPEGPTSSPPAPPTFVRWPPPGLERMQGDLWRVASRGALTGGLLVVPLLFVIAREPELASLGPFADAWWITLVLATVGLGFALDALATASRMMRRASSALGHGYDWATIAYVLADLRRDMGFLLQGGRHFSEMDARERTAIAGLRVLAVGFHALAGLWLPVALALGIVLAARGVMDHQALWMSTLLPSVLLYSMGGAAGAMEDGRVRRARRRWFRQPWASDLVSGEIDEWRTQLARADGVGDRPASSAAPLVRGLSVLVGALTVLVAVPILTLVPASGVGPVLAMVAVPNFHATMQRGARAEAYRPYRVDPDPGLSPTEAGVLLHDLLYVGPDRQPGPGERPRTRRFEEPWLAELDAENPVGVQPQRWSESLFEILGRDPNPVLVAYLGGIAQHEAHEDFSRLASAEDIDIAAGRWSDLVLETHWTEVPIPRLSALRTGSYAHIGAAGYELAMGRPDRAEEMLREVVSVGLLLVDRGPTLIENLIGGIMARDGGRALASFYRETGRSEEADALTRLEASVEAAVDRIHAEAPRSVEAFIRAMPPMITDTTVMRGLRWEYFVLASTLTPCLNMSRMVFGPDDGYARFVEEARASLVRWPSEEPLFELASQGFFPGPSGVGEGILGRVLAISMRSGEGSCGQIVRRLRAVGALF